jgi:Na+/proline symporter
MTGFLSDPNTQSKAYWTLGSAAVATAAAAMLLPGFFAGLMFGAATDPVVDSIARAAGATLITSATVKYTLKVCAPIGFHGCDHGHLMTCYGVIIGFLLGLPGGRMKAAAAPTAAAAGKAK